MRGGLCIVGMKAQGPKVSPIHSPLQPKRNQCWKCPQSATEHYRWIVPGPTNPPNPGPAHPNPPRTAPALVPELRQKGMKQCQTSCSSLLWPPLTQRRWLGLRCPRGLVQIMITQFTKNENSVIIYSHPFQWKMVWSFIVHKTYGFILLLLSFFLIK